MDAFGPYLARLPEGDLLSAYLTGKCGVQLCYLGYWVPNQLITLAFLDEHQRQGPMVSSGQDVHVEGERVALRSYWDRRERGTTVLRLRPGIERFMITQIGTPAGSVSRRRGWIPVMWEMADTTPAAGGWVLYMDGHTEWLPYGTFPVTGKIVTRLRDFVPPPAQMAPDRQPQVDSRPPLHYRWTNRRPSPVHEIASDIADSLPLFSFKLVHCDTTPSVKARGYEGYRIRIKARIEVVLFPADIEVDDEFKYRIWPRGSEERDTVVADLGVGQGYHWFARAPVGRQDNFREDFGLTGGDDRLQHMIDTNAFHLMPRLGDQAMPYLESVVSDDEKLDHFPDAIMALGQIGTAEARQLISAAFDPDNKDAFRNAEALTRSADFRASRYGLGLTDETVDAVVEAFLTLEDQDALARNATGYATLTGMFVTYHRNRIGRAILKRLPDDVVDRALDSLREVSPSQAQRLGSQLRDN